MKDAHLWRERIVELLLTADVNYWEIPVPWTSPMRIGISVKDTSSAFEALKERYPEAQVTLLGVGTRWKDARTYPVNEAQKHVNQETGSFLIHDMKGMLGERTLMLEAGAVELELWRETSQGTLRCSFQNFHASELDLEVSAPRMVRVHGKEGRSLDDFGDRTPSQVEFPIDAVYLWVDDSDAEWEKRRTAALANATHVRPEAASNSRFRQHDELRYSLRSLMMFAPWVRNVYIVTDRQVPSWLQEEAPGVQVIDHADILPFSALPCYNSHALSSVLHRIEGLSEHFLYLNDDVFFGRPTDPLTWFTSDGQVRIHHSGVSGPGDSVSEVIIPVAARRNSSRLVRELEGTVPRRNLQHGPHALRKSLLEGMWEKWQDKLEVTCLNHFRDVSDIEPVWLHNGYALNLKEAVIGPACSYKYVLMDSPNALLQLEGLLHRRDRDIFCLNDGVGDTEDVEMDDQERAKLYKSFLSGYFPTRSRFEKHSDED